MSIRTTLKVTVLAATLLAAFGTTAQATPVNLVSNGTFETNGGNGELMPGTTSGNYISSAKDWYTTTTSGSTDASNNQGYPFLFLTNNAVTTGFGDAWDKGQRYLWGASNGGSSSWDGSSPDGGYYLVMDADYHHTAISQNVAGLVKGTDYSLTFEWAAAQWTNATGNTTEYLTATLGGQSQNTSTTSLTSKGFSGWISTTLNFRYDGTSNVLSFLASGGPSGLPPTVVLDDVSLVAVPEPASVAMLALGLGAAGLVVARRRRATVGARLS